MQLPKQFKRKQAGFIQNFIIPGIILIGVVIAGIAMLASNSGGTDTSNEKASMAANAVVGNGLTLSSAIQRAEADGALTDSVARDMGGLFTDVDLATVLVTGKYLTALPASPMPGLDQEPGYFRTYPGSTDAGMSVSGVGSFQEDDVLTIYLGAADNALALSVCNRINNKILGTPSQGDATGQPVAVLAEGVVGIQDRPGVTEGCFVHPDGTYHYFKVVNAK